MRLSIFGPKRLTAYITSNHAIVLFSYSMLNSFQTVNNSLTEELLEEAKTIFEQNQRGARLLGFDKLPQMLHEMKIIFPESMMTEINRCLSVYPIPRFSFNAFTHFVARATLEEELEEEFRSLFFNIDRRKTGKADAQDLSELLRQLNGGERMGEAGVNELLGEIDFLGVGYLNFEDLVYLLLPK